MTDAEIDNLKGYELDQAFAKAFDYRPITHACFELLDTTFDVNFDSVREVLDTDAESWRPSLTHHEDDWWVGLGKGEIPGFGLSHYEIWQARGSTPAEAMCRAALKAKQVKK